MYFNLGESKKSTIVYEDNQAYICWAADHEKRKHIYTVSHMCREVCDNGEIVLKYCPSTEMMADNLTKPLNLNKLKISN